MVGGLIFVEVVDLFCVVISILFYGNVTYREVSSEGQILFQYGGDEKFA